MARNRHRTKPKASDYSPTSIGGMVDVLKIKRHFTKELRDGDKTPEKSLSRQREKE